MEGIVSGTEPESYSLILVGTVTSVTAREDPAGYSDVSVHAEVVFTGPTDPELTIPAQLPLPTGVTFDQGRRYFIVGGSFPYLPPALPLEVDPCGPSQQVDPHEVARLVALSESEVVLDDAALPGLDSLKAAWAVPLLLGVTAVGLLLVARRVQRP